jgi:hypothetical protein
MGFDAFLRMNVGFSNGFQAVALTIPDEYKDKEYQNLRGWRSYFIALVEIIEGNSVEIETLHDALLDWDEAKECFDKDNIKMTEDDYTNFIGFIKFLLDFQQSHDTISFDYSLSY